MSIPSFGELLVSENIITDEQLERALSLQKSSRDQRNLIGVILIRLGYITMETLIKYLEVQTEMLMNDHPEKKVPPIGELLIRNGEITREQLMEALKQQERSATTPLGIILVQLDYIDADVLIRYLIKQTALAIDEE